MSDSPGQRFKQWRHICGFTQKEAGEMLGYSTDAIISVENERLALSEKMARCCTAVSGVCFMSLLNGDGEMLTLSGRPFDRKAFLLWPTQGERFAALGGARHAINRQRF